MNWVAKRLELSHGVQHPRWVKFSRRWGVLAGRTEVQVVVQWRSIQKGVRIFEQSSEYGCRHAGSRRLECTLAAQF